MEIAQHASENKKILMMNLSAPFLSQFFKEPMMKAFPFIDILFGNETVEFIYYEVQLVEYYLSLFSVLDKSRRQRLLLRNKIFQLLTAVWKILLYRLQLCPKKTKILTVLLSSLKVSMT